MGKIVKIAHISDTHVSRQYYREHMKSLKMLLREMLHDGIDHILVTGDIVSTGEEDDYYLAREIFQSFGLLNAERMTVVPGNHDIFGGPHRAIDILSFPQHIRSVDYVRGLELFQQFFAETFYGCTRLHPTQLYPFVKKLDDVQIVGLNSIPPWSLRYNPLGSNGMLDAGQYEALERLAAAHDLKNSYTIVLLHHHFNDLVKPDIQESGKLWLKVESRTMRMRKRKKLLKLFQQLGVRYVFHGHIHRNEVYERNNIQFVNGAGAVCDDPVRFLKYNVLERNDDYWSLKIKQLPIPYCTSPARKKLYRVSKPLTVPAFSIHNLEYRSL
ncbi:MAG: metallophosphoesterase [Bacteroidetes bacterium]|nr:metallophosphoesterase [Bacteroidota bacterium]